MAAKKAKTGTEFNPNRNDISSDICKAIINDKANACPMAVRLAWHAAGTWEEKSKTGGSNGATMMHPLEANDGANAGLGILRDMLVPVSKAHPDVSLGDIWTLAGATAIQLSGGPQIGHSFGRVDKAADACPPNGRLPDASQGAQHLRDVFYRMGFDDRAIVSLSGAHTLGSCHRTRSGFDGPWTRHPLKFDNTYFKNLLNLKWTVKKWDGPKQFEDETGELMMLPTDIALIEDPKFKEWVEKYAADEKLFYADFAKDFERLTHCGCPMSSQPSEQEVTNGQMREAAMHGSLDVVKALAPNCDINSVDADSGRSALHKAAFWGHDGTISFLVDSKADVNLKDAKGDVALHDAARFGHKSCVELLLKAGADKAVTNNAGQTAKDAAVYYGKPEIAKLFE